ncbi:GNAT family N-acetyltransferase [Psychromicrobium sp. YIM B11713]|uniref:GNAT family N-acetyltransferase n=1 Tax=Psychromicrobium sp. YIM B11713 TaxID=3145233 RepID=UPI00374F8AE7
MEDKLRIAPLTLPESLAAPDAAEFLEVSQLVDTIKLAIWGNADRLSDARSRLVSWRDNDYDSLQIFLGRLEGKMVGLSWTQLPLKDNLHAAVVHAAVLPEYRRQGYGRALLEVAEDYAQKQGRKVLIAGTEHSADFDPEGSDLLAPNSGTGAIPAGASGTRFALQLGYRLEQVERFSSLSLPVPAEKLDSLRNSAEFKAGPDYTLVFWQDHCPDELAESFAQANSRMSTDVPTAGLEIEPEVWSVSRLRQHETQSVESGHRIDVCAALHLPSGEIAAYTYFDFNPRKPTLIHQEDTLVISEHRGRRLGMLIKAANLQRIQQELPQLRKAITWNAAENDHMLDINIELGFTPAGYDGEWQKSPTS